MAHTHKQAFADDPETKSNPLEVLSGELDDDMRKVNALILANMQSDVPLIPQLAGYLIASGGKRIRPLLTLACTSIFKADMARAHRLAAAVEFIHTATLLHDDVVDESDQRRGKDAANIVFGNQASVLVGDFLFSKSFQLMVADGNLDILRILSDASATIAQGEVKQLSTKGNINASMSDYIEVISSKTGALFAAACEVGPVIANQDKTVQQAFHQYGLNLGIAFQIADDVLDYNADRTKLGKTIGDDFREGKMTAPVLIAIENANEEEMNFWQRVMADNKQTDQDLDKAINILNSHNALERGLQMALDYGVRATAALSSHKSSMELQSETDVLTTALYDLVCFSIHRGH